MNNIEKIKKLSSEVLNEKDYNLVLSLIDKHDFDSFIELIAAEIKKEYKHCKPEEMTNRYTSLLDLSYNLQKYDINSYFEINEKKYEEYE